MEKYLFDYSLNFLVMPPKLKNMILLWPMGSSVKLKLKNIHDVLQSQLT